MRSRWLVLAALGLFGCESLHAPIPDPAPNPPSPVPPRDGGVESPLPTSGRGLGEGSAPNPPSRFPPREGGEGPGSPPRFGEGPGERSGQRDGGLGSTDPDPLTLAAQCLERGDQPGACGHLEAYVRAHPDQIMFRAHLAELLFQLDRPRDSRAHFEQFIADAQAATGPPQRHLVHCHTRLMEIGQRTDDRFAEVFHRGVGLLLVHRQMQAEPDRDEGTCEEILCKAMKSLNEAKELKPADPRVSLYLADAHDRTGNRRGAETARAAARTTSTPGSLTPAEQQRLMLRDHPPGR